METNSRPNRSLFVIGLVLCQLVGFSSPTYADPPGPQQPSGQQPPAQQPMGQQPTPQHSSMDGGEALNMGLMWFLPSYAGAALAGGLADSRSLDRILFLPGLGPFIDAADPAKSGAGRFLLITDGIVQGVGLALIIAGAVQIANSHDPGVSDDQTPKTDPKKDNDKTAMKVSPAGVGSGYGLSLSGAF